MGVVEKLQAPFGQRFASPIEDRRGVATGLFIEWIIMGNPGAADILQAQRPRLPRDAFEVVAISVEREMTADASERDPSHSPAHV